MGMIPLYRKDSWLGPWALVVSAALMMESCGGGGESGNTAETDFTPSMYNSAYVSVNLTDGTIRSETAERAKGSATTLMLKRASDGNYVGITEITKGQWTTVMGTKPWMAIPGSVSSVASADDAGQPACNLSRVDCVAFCSKVTKSSRLTLTLPSAAALGTLVGGTFPWGTSVDSATVSANACVAETKSADGPGTVGSRAAASGFYDLIGSVREWTNEGALFGGSWNDAIQVIKSNRVVTSIEPEFRHPLAGFRVTTNG